MTTRPATRRPGRTKGGVLPGLDRIPSSADLCATLPPWGDGIALVRIGSQAIRLAGLDARLVELVRDQYAGFVQPADADFLRPSSTVEVLRSPEPHYLHLRRGQPRAEEARVGAEAAGDFLELWSYTFAARFDLEASRARLLLCEAGDLDTYQAIENFLRFLVSTAALATRGFLLHSSGIVRAGRACLFFGPSGAGKSTAVANSPPAWPRLGDDLVLVEREGEGYRACGVPFRGSFKSAAPNSGACAPVAMACRLLKSDVVRLDRASTVIQVAEVLGELPFLVDDPGLQSRAVACVERFVRHVAVYRLHLRNDGSFWDALPG